MNTIQKQLTEVFGYPEKYKMDDNDRDMLKNTVRLLIRSLVIISELGLESELTKKSDEN